jgi:hypothetical protein
MTHHNQTKKLTTWFVTHALNIGKPFSIFLLAFPMLILSGVELIEKHFWYMSFA